MKASELILLLASYIRDHGDLEVKKAEWADDDADNRLPFNYQDVSLTEIYTTEPHTFHLSIWAR